jgi:endonuclease YncB( thermonuclease family)
MRVKVGRSAIRLAIPLAVVAALVTIDRPAVAGQVVSVIDGDTFAMDDGRTIRLHGIDAPALKKRCGGPGHRSWPCGARAQQKLKQWTKDTEVYCDIRGRDRDGNTLATCWGGGVDLAREMVRSGLAKVYRRESRFYEVDEAEARMVGRGLWQQPTPAVTAVAAR